MKSIICNDKECYICGTTVDLHRHHIFFGTANRKLSEKYGCWVYLCAHHHNMSDLGVHHNRELDLRLKQTAQKVFEEKYSHEKFVTVFGRSWL